LGAGFWLDGDSFNGTVLRAGLNAYSIEYRSEAQQDFAATGEREAVTTGSVIDRATVKQRRLSFLIGSHRTWSYFTLAVAFGLEYELNKDRRCIVPQGNIYEVSTSSDDCRHPDDFELARSPLGDRSAPDTVGLFGDLHPFYIVGRISLGVVFDK
jgi:hypothetical protein